VQLPAISSTKVDVVDSRKPLINETIKTTYAMNIKEFFKAGYKLQNSEKIRLLTVAIAHLPVEWQEEGTTGNDVLEGLHIMLQEILAEEYTEPDNVWPSRRWNKEGTDFIDLSE